LRLKQGEASDAVPPKDPVSNGLAEGVGRHRAEAGGRERSTPRRASPSIALIRHAK
jgi:hypothetical protein